MQGNSSNCNGRYCPHCSETLSMSSYYVHKKLYFKNGSWVQKNKEKPITDEIDLELNEDPENNASNNCSDDNDDAIEVESFSEEEDLEIWESQYDPSEDFDDGDGSEEPPQQACDNNLLIGSQALVEFAELFPSTIYKARKILSLDRDDFIKYIPCPKCHKLYTYDQAQFVDNDNKKQSALCDYIAFPNHPHQNMRRACGSKLMKSVVSLDGRRNLLYPYKVYTYQSLKVSLERLLARKDVLDQLKVTIDNTRPAGDCLYDIYDGSVWRSFKDNQNNIFFSDRRNLGGILNIDWFQPFEKSEGSLGVIYLVLLNLPREIRFKKENVIIVGIIPGPKEPELVVNTFLKPFVEELLIFWRGVYLKENGSDCLYRFVLLCISSDLPATRKCCGFMSYNAIKGCSKCLKRFPRDEENKPDYSGYDIENWISRNPIDHRNNAAQTLLAATATEKSALESQHGVRYSELLRLPYFNPIIGHLVDVMHNMLLGSAKHHFKILIIEGHIDDNKIKLIDIAISEVKVPSEVGRVTKSMSLYKSMKAAEWKNWVMIFSLYALKDLLSKRHYNLWQIFVRACKLLINTSISNEELNLGHELIILYCKKFQELYGKRHCVPNMHMHLHIKSCILEFGPTYGFWCFSFERYNGILGSFATNNHALTITIMRKFINILRLDTSYQQLEVEDLPSLEYFKLKDTSKFGENTSNLDSIRRNLNVTIKSVENIFETLSTSKLSLFSEEQIAQVSTEIEILLEDSNLIEICHYYKSFSKIRLGREILSVQRANEASNRDSHVIAKMPSNIGIDDERPATISKICQVDFEVQNQSTEVISKKSLMFVIVDFLQVHPERNWFGANCPMELYYTMYEPSCIIPLHFVKRRCSIVKGKQYFNPLHLANGRITARVRDTVYFVL